MELLGKFTIDREGLIYDLRAKLPGVLSAIGYDRQTSTQQLAFLSEICKERLSLSRDSELCLYYKPSPSALVFEVIHGDPISSTLRLNGMFSNTSMKEVEDGGHVLQFYRPASGRSSAGKSVSVEELRKQLTIKSREELMAELEGSNAALLKHSEQLEATVQERTKDFREAKDAADQANQVKGDFLATMSHEIRTPMNAILNMTQLSLDADLPGKTRRYLEVVQSSGNSLLSLIDDILDFSKIEASKIELEEIPFSLHQLLDEVTDSFRGKAYDKKLEFVAGASHKVPPQIVGDSLRIRQVLFNLIGNAFKFTEEGEIVLNVKVEKEESNPDNPKLSTTWLHFSVRDTGIGIPKDKQGKLFQSFSQGDSSTTRKYGGTGLGLAISKKLVELMGGDLTITSAEGEGTDFHFSAPFEFDPKVSHEDYASRLGNQSVNVLIVEDTPSTADLFATMLARFGMDSETVSTAEDALKRLVDGKGNAIMPKPDIILMDWLLPGMDGIEATQKIRANRMIADIPIIMVSACASETHEARALELGANGFIQKPVTASTLFDAVFRQLDASYSTAFFRREDVEKDDLATDMNRLKGARILMAEDNEANQFVVEELFDQAGINITVANNGLEALEKLETDATYDGVLMDMQMPEMDGLTATREIRKRWPDLKLPIIALTANAMKGDQERCTEAGMDDYVSKPIDRNQLFRALLKWVKAKHPSDPSAKSDPTDQGAANEIPTLQGIDIDDALQRLGLPWTSIKKMLLRFADGQPAIRAELRAAIDAEDWETARRHAHSIAGASGNLSANELRHSAKALENAIKDEQGDYEPLNAAMNAELETVLAAVATIRPEPAAAAKNDKPIDEPAIKAALETLKHGLGEYDMVAIEAAMQAVNAMGIPAELKAGIAGISRLVEDYDYFGAAAKVDKLLPQLN
jgi:two-component system, sensor histidine kinase and response regulator